MNLPSIESLKKHPIGVAAVIVIVTASLTSTVWHEVVVEDLRDKKADLFKELEVSKQRVSSLEATLAGYEAQCLSRIQTHGKDTQERCNRQLSSVVESQKALASSQEKLLDELQRKDRTVAATSAQLGIQRMTLSQLVQLKSEEKILSDKISVLHAKDQKLARDYGYAKAECDKEGISFGNICEHASMNKSELESIEREIESTKLRLSQVQQQIIQLQTSSK
jgi:chromosome segregation ATPase